MKNKNIYLSGEKLYGDDFNIQEIKKWYDDEKEGYSGLIDSKDYFYEYHLFDIEYAFKYLNKIKRFDKVLGIGSAYGHEFLPISERINNLYIIEPSKVLRSKKIKNVKPKYLSPNQNGKINFKDNTFDLITCFSVLHHIPNVSFVIKELARVLKNDGYLLIREPTISMGDWTQKRKGITKRERGIPLQLFGKILKENNLKIISEKRMMFPITRRISAKGKGLANNRMVLLLDRLLSKTFSFNKRYHANNLFQKLQPQSVVYVLKKSR
jgi:SAM-dependent methyltransferase